MGSSLSHIKSLLKKRSTLASVVIVPAVLVGLGLVVFQTYSAVTGESLFDFDFKIGKLWQTSEPKKETEDGYNFIETFTGDFELDNASEDNDFIDFIRLSQEPIITKLKPQFAAAEEVEKKTEAKVRSEYFDVSTIDPIKITSLLKSKQFIKYQARLESEYLINPNITPLEGKWYVGVSFSPTLNYRTFGYDPTLVTGVAIEGNYRYTFGLTENQRNVSDKSVTAYTVGVDVGRKITDKLSVRTGIYYAHYGEQVLVQRADKEDIGYEGASFYSQKPHYQIYSSADALESIPFKNRYSYFEIPLGINIKVLEKKNTDIGLDVGITLQKLDHVNALVYDFDTDYYYWMNSKQEMFREFGVGTNVGFTFSQFLGERLQLVLNPHFKMNLNSTFKKPYPVNQNQYTTGLRVGLQRQIN